MKREGNCSVPPLWGLNSWGTRAYRSGLCARFGRREASLSSAYSVYAEAKPRHKRILKLFFALRGEKSEGRAPLNSPRERGRLNSYEEDYKYLRRIRSVRRRFLSILLAACFTRFP